MIGCFGLPGTFDVGQPSVVALMCLLFVLLFVLAKQLVLPGSSRRCRCLRVVPSLHRGPF